MSQTKSHSFQSEHSPRGAAASFSIGHVGHGGGFSLESGKTGCQDLYIGTFRDGCMSCLPYNAKATDAHTGMAEFIPTGDPEAGKFDPIECRVIEPDRIQRHYRLATDTFQAEDIRFSLVTPVGGIPDPTQAPREAYREAICPAITGRLVFDNRKGSSEMKGFFAVGQLPGFRQLDELTGGALAGVATLGATVSPSPMPMTSRPSATCSWTSPSAGPRQTATS